MIVYERQEGVPRFECEEYRERTSDYVVLIPVINEGERILAELRRAQQHAVAQHANIVLCDGGSTDGSTKGSVLQGLGVNTLLVKRDTGRQGTQLRMGIWWALRAVSI